MDIGYKWTIQGMRGTAVSTQGSFDTKREAITAMEGKREFKTAIQRDGRNYTFTEKKK